MPVLGAPRVDEAGRDAGAVSRGARAAVVVFVLYGALALAANWPMWPGDPSRFRTFGYGALGGGDVYEATWFLAWVPHALLHGANPFYTDALNYPGGINLVQNPLSPLLGLLFSPVTLTAGPISSINLALWLAFPLSATAMYATLGRWVSWQPAAFLGGLLYGFSPYMVTQGTFHLDLAFVPLPPLIVTAMYEVVRSPQRRRRRWGVWLGTLLAAQFLICSEVCATTLLVGVVAGLVVGVARRHDVRAALTRSAGALSVAFGILAAVVAYPLWVFVAGPDRYTGAAYPNTAADLLSTVVPTSMQRVAPAGWVAEGNRLLMGNTTENGVYLGVPLLLLLVMVAVAYRQLPRVRFATAMVLATVLLSWGPNLVVANHVTALPLPFTLLVHLPFVDNMLTARLSLYTDMFAAALLAVGLDEARRRWTAARAPHAPRRRPVLGGVAWGGAGVVGVLALVSLVPAWPYPTSGTGVPRYFTTGAADRIPARSAVLVFPYPSIYDDQPQLWQAVDKLRFDLVGGYGLFRGPGGTSDNFPESLAPGDVGTYLWNATYGGDLPQVDSQLLCDTRKFLLVNDVETVIVSTVSPASVSQPARAELLFESVLGVPSSIDPPVIAWYDVTSKVTTQAAAAACS